MTLAEFKQHIWSELPPVRRMLVGREVVDDLVEIAVHQWESEVLLHCVNDTERQAVAANILRSVRRGYQAISGREPDEFGVFFWPILLQAVASLVVGLILQWWLAKRINRVRLDVWKTEMHR
jgi:hypothetical protein